MKILSLDFIYGYDYNLHKIYSMNQHWENNSLFHMRVPRPTSALLYASGCSMEYTLGNEKSIYVNKGDIVYIPQGSIYTTKFVETLKESVGTVLIEFTTADLSGEPFIFYPDITVLACNSEELTEYFSEMVSIFISATPSIALEKSVLYRILSHLGYTEKLTGLHSKEFSSIADGIIYMESNIIQEKSIAEIAEMCHVSTSCFRKLFKKYSGISPIQYQINIKISHAKKLLRSNTMSISEISDYLQFSDAAYFCKLFKKHTGVTPSEYSRKFNPQTHVKQ